jgi:hypothetical protein
LRSDGVEKKKKKKKLHVLGVLSPSSAQFNLVNPGS